MRVAGLQRMIRGPAVPSIMAVERRRVLHRFRSANMAYAGSRSASHKLSAAIVLLHHVELDLLEHVKCGGLFAVERVDIVLGDAERSDMCLGMLGDDSCTAHPDTHVMREKVGELPEGLALNLWQL